MNWVTLYREVLRAMNKASREEVERYHEWVTLYREVLRIMEKRPVSRREAVQRFYRFHKDELLDPNTH